MEYSVSGQGMSRCTEARGERNRRLKRHATGGGDGWRRRVEYTRRVAFASLSRRPANAGYVIRQETPRCVIRDGVRLLTPFVTRSGMKRARTEVNSTHSRPEDEEPRGGKSYNAWRRQSRRRDGTRQASSPGAAVRRQPAAYARHATFQHMTTYARADSHRIEESMNNGQERASRQDGSELAELAERRREVHAKAMLFDMRMRYSRGRNSANMSVVKW